MKQQIDSTICYKERQTFVLRIFVVVSVLLIFLVFCDVRYNFLIKTMFGSSLPPVVYRSDHALFTLFLFVCVY